MGADAGEAAIFSIGDLARRASTKVETVRWYEREGLLPAPARTAGGHRAYTRPHLDRLAFVRHARELGFPLESVRACSPSRTIPTGHAARSMQSRAST